MVIKNKTFDEERALYGICNSEIVNCRFDGKADGESALKETRNIIVKNSDFLLRYPLWHVNRFTVSDSFFGDTCRAPVWYSENGTLRNCRISGVKAVRECKNVNIENCDIQSDEFLWKCESINIRSSSVKSSYFALELKDGTMDNLTLFGKYSFQYGKNFTVQNSVLDTKDAFWHSENITVKDTVINGEYLGWYSTGLTLINCKISGTQPLCYCKNLTLIGCTMENCDLSFEYSDVSADIIGNIESVKNPLSGIITADSVGEIITSGSVMKTDCQIKIR